jgi:hypothetical protein
MAADDQKLRVRLVGRNGRRRYEAASKERLVTACLEPGVSVSRLALEQLDQFDGNASGTSCASLASS